jgi:hypothetical protein
MSALITATQLAVLWPLLGGMGVFLAVYAIASRQPRLKRAVSVYDEIRRTGPGVGLAYGLAAEREAGGKGAQIEQWLRAANWFWAPGEMSPPVEGAPFYSVRGFYAASIYEALLYGIVGFLMGLGLAFGLQLPVLFAPVVAALTAYVGFTGPEGRLRQAVQARQYRMMVELAFRLPELAVIVSTGKSITTAMRTLVARPGGPFTTEMARFLRIYDATTSLEVAAQGVIAHNRFRPLSEFFQQVMLVEERGGSIGPALQVQAEEAQATLYRQLLEQGLENARSMELPVVAGSALTVVALVGGPALWLLLVYL